MVKISTETKMAVKKYVELNNLLYEVDERGERVLVRSSDSSSRAYLRFTNKTRRPLDVWWRDFRGTKHHYLCLDPNAYVDINTFLTHPWEFTDVDTKERYVINNMPVYQAPTSLGGMGYRTNWNITISVRTLRETALLSIAYDVRQPSTVRALGLPRDLENDLEELVNILHIPREAPQEQGDVIN